MSDHIVDANKMVETPRTDDVRHYLRTRDDFTETDNEVWYRFGTILERELAAANARVRELEKLFGELTTVAYNERDHRQWVDHYIGWLHPGQCAYVGPQKPDGLC